MQKCVTTATCEAEYVALCDASKEALFMRVVLVFLQPGSTGMRMKIFGDNEGAKAIADNPSSASRSKHIDFHSGINSRRGSRYCAHWDGGTARRCPYENPFGERNS